MDRAKIIYEGCNPNCPELLEKSRKRRLSLEGAIVLDDFPRLDWQKEIAPVIRAQGYQWEGRCCEEAFNAAEGKFGHCCMRSVRPSAQEAMG